MKIDQIKEVLSVCLKTKTTPMIWGQHGVGKSQIVKQYCDENGLGFVDLRLGQVEAGDLIGMPERDNDKTMWLKPNWFPTDGKGIIFLDEINRGRPDVLQAIFQLVLDRKLFTHILPNEWNIICAANPPIDEYNVVELDKALMNRFLHIKLDVDFKVWKDWAKDNINEDIIKVLETNKNLLNFNQEWQDQIKQKPTPRGWEIFSRFVNDIQDDKLLLEIGNGIIGLEATQIFIQQRKHNFMYFDESDVLENFGSIKHKIEKVINDKKNNDVFYDINQKLMTTMITRYENMTQNQKLNLAKYLNVLPSDLASGFVKELLEKNEMTFTKYLSDCKNDKELEEEFQVKLLKKIQSSLKNAK